MIANRIPQDRASEADSIYTLVTRLAAGSSDRRLAATLAITLIAAAGLCIAVPAMWPLAALAGTVGAVSLWGLLSHRVAHHPSAILSVVRVALLALGLFLTAAAGVRIWFAMLGPRWML